MEMLVLDKLDTVLAQYPDCCKCDRCRQDIAILALNHLPPRYISSAKGSVFMKVNSMTTENSIEVIEQIAKAVEIVQKNPRHEENA
ncbi:MAG: late competence development ComFB family protein [Schwartzia sp.]|nr:late competence development ComFB family protein [Schwartzia sp. (in: firmicutes)]